MSAGLTPRSGTALPAPRLAHPDRESAENAEEGVPRHKLGSTSVSRRRRTPVLGGHTDEVLSQVLNRSDDEIAKLHDEKIVAGP